MNTLRELERVIERFTSRGAEVPLELTEALALARAKEAALAAARADDHAKFEQSVAEWDASKAAGRVVGRAVDATDNQTSSESVALARREHIREELRNTPKVPRVEFIITSKGVAVPCDDCKEHAFARDMERLKVTRRVPDAGFEDAWKAARADRRWDDLDLIPSHLITLRLDLCPLCVIKHTTRAGQLQVIPDHLIPALARYKPDRAGGERHGGVGQWENRTGPRPDTKATSKDVAATTDPEGFTHFSRSYRRFVRGRK